MPQEPNAVNTNPDFRNAIYYQAPFESNYIPHILEEIYLKKIYQPFLEGRTDLQIMDIGCNIGLFTLYAAQYAKTVYAVEPSEAHFKTMALNFLHNGIENVVPIRKALSNENGTTRFYHNQNKTMYSLKDVVNDKNDYEEVETVTIDKLFADNKIEQLDMLKLDMEGSEGELVVSEEFRKTAPKIAVIVGEYHSWASMNQAMFADVFADLGFEFKWYKDTDASVFSAVRL